MHPHAAGPLVTSPAPANTILPGMTQRHSGLTVPSTDYGRAIVQDLAILALVTAVALAGALAVRPVTSYDIGYHLAYGEHFLRTGEIVQTNRFIYTRLDKAILADPSGPGGP